MGVLPFRQLGELREHDGAVVVEVPCSVWPATASRTDVAARVHDHVGEAPASFASELRKRNRHLLVDGTRYNIVAVIEQPLALAHAQLELRSVGAA